jgi:hypothetical protein
MKFMFNFHGTTYVINKLWALIDPIIFVRKTSTGHRKYR